MRVSAVFSTAVLTILAVGGGARLAAMTWEEAVAASKRWCTAPFIAQAVQLAAENPAFLHLVGKNFGRDSKAVTVAFNGVPAVFELVSPNHLVTLMPAGVGGDKVLVAVTVAGTPSDPEDVTTVRIVADPVELLLKPGGYLFRNEVRSPDRSARIEWLFSTNAYNILVASSLGIPDDTLREALDQLREMP